MSRPTMGAPAVRAALLLVFVLAASPARADAPSVERKYRAALDLRGRGEDAAALALFREIESLAPTARSIAQVALGEQATGAWVLAERDMLVAFERGGDWIAQNRAALDGALATIRRHLGSLEIVCDECTPDAAAHVFVDGIDSGSLPRVEPLRLELGKHRFDVRAPNAFDVSRDVEIAPGKLVRERVRLVRASGAGSAAVSPATSVAPAVPPRESLPVETRSRSTTATVLIVSAFGLAAVSLGAATFFGLSSNGAATDYNDDPRCADANKPTHCTELRERVDGQRTLAVVAGVAGAAFAGAGIAVLLGSAPSSAKVTIGPRQASFVIAF